MHSQPSLIRKVRSQKQRTKFADIWQYKSDLVSVQPQLESGNKSSTLLRQWQMSLLISKRRKIHILAVVGR